MNETISLDDVALFKAVADAGSLSAAARGLGTSLPTLSRRMVALERAVGRRLFNRGPAGYSLTSDGRSFADCLLPLASAQSAIAEWVARDVGPPTVRITAGYWTTRHLSLATAGHPSAAFSARFLPANAKLDIARREADIGVRNAAPEHPWLARKRLGQVDFAIFGRDGAKGFVVGPSSVASQRWVREAHVDDIRHDVPDTRLALDMALAGHGRIVLPVFAGKSTGLVQVSAPITSLRHDRWLVSHHDARHDPAVRSALDHVESLLAG